MEEKVDRARRDAGELPGDTQALDKRGEGSRSHSTAMAEKVRCNTGDVGSSLVKTKALEEKGTRTASVVTYHGGTRDVVGGSGRADPGGDDALAGSEDV